MIKKIILGSLLSLIFLFILNLCSHVHLRPTETLLTDIIDSTFHNYKGAYHIHTNYSDGSATFDDLKLFAHTFDFIITTDHNHLRPRHAQEYGVLNGMTLLTEQEVSTANNSGHFTSLGFDHQKLPSADFFYNDRLPSDSLFRGNLNIIAHPLHTRDKMKWKDFSQPFHGFEIWNYDVSWRHHFSSFWGILSIVNSLLLSDYFPWLLQSGVTYPLNELNKVSELNRPVLIFAATDAHSKIKLWGDTFLQIPDYASILPIMTIHLLTEKVLTVNYESNRTNILTSLRQGEFYLANDGLSESKGFQSLWTIREKSYSKNKLYMHPDSALWQIRIPNPMVPITVQIFKNDSLFKTSSDLVHNLIIHDSGIYRLEVLQHRTSWNPFIGTELIPWIFTQYYWLDKSI